MSDKYCPTPHNTASKEQISKYFLMPGDPKRSKMISESFLDDPVLFNDVRGVQGYTGKYKGISISCMASGMGMPSIGIYSYELYNFYDVDTIIRVGSAGSINKDIKIGDVLLASSASYTSSYADQYDLSGKLSTAPDFLLMKDAYSVANDKNISVKAGPVLSSDIYYDDDPDTLKQWQKMGICAVEMEAAALYMNAMRAGKKALSILSISNDIMTGQNTDQTQRNSLFDNAIEIALDTIVKRAE